jgi:hypothetical protein
LRVKIVVTLSHNGIPLDAPVDIYIDNTYYTTLYTVNGYAETIIETEGKVFSASYKGSDDFEASLSHCVLITAIPYTLRYGLTYLQWAKLKAKRIRDTLLIFYRKGAPVDLQILAERVYIERLSKTSKLKWMPIKGSFTDFKPSPFMKNFLNYLISRLVTDGYILLVTDGYILYELTKVPTLEYLERLCTWTP